MISQWKSGDVLFSIITGEAGEIATVDVDREYSEGFTAGGQCGWT
jgi:hypothetical protein